MRLFLSSPMRTLFFLCLSLALCGQLSAREDKYNFGRDKLDLPAWATPYLHAPTPDYAKNAGTVLLYVGVTVSVDASGRATERTRTVERILNPEGRREAECAFSFSEGDKVPYFNAWTVDASGRTFQARETDFREFGDWTDSSMISAARAFYVRPPAADIGSVYVCESEKMQPAYIHQETWNLQQPREPIAFEEFELDLPPGMKLVSNQRNFKELKATEAAPNHWLWQIHDTPALDLRDQPSVPEFEALTGRLTVLWSELATSPEHGKQWQQIGQWYTGLEGARSIPSPALTTEAQQLTAGAPDFYTKLARISEYIQNNVRYFVVERGIGGHQAHFASDIFRNRYGDCKDKSILLITMLSTVGIHAYPVLVDHRRGVVDPNSPSSWGDHMISAIEIPEGVNDPHLEAIVKDVAGRRLLIFDPTDEETPIGNLPTGLQGGWGLIADGERSQILPLPLLRPESNASEYLGQFTLSADGHLSGSIQTSHTGPAASEMRYMVKHTDDKERRAYWEKILAHDLPGVTLDSFTFVKPDSLAKPMELNYKFTAAHYAKLSGPMLLVRPRVRGEWALYFDDKPRTLPLDLDKPQSLHAHFEITLPEGFAVDELPDPVNLDNDFGSYHASCTAQDGKLIYDRTLKIHKVDLPASRAGDFRAFESTILRDEKNSAVLMRK